jgi:solute carrier family 25 phosphate transporter 23/24/25/41
MQCEVVEGGLRGNRLIASTAQKMWSANGLVPFFRGLPLGLIGMFPYAAFDLMTFEYLKAALVSRKARINHCHEDDAPLSNFTTGAIGAFSGAFSASTVYPLNVLRTRLQAQGTVLHKPTYTGIVDVTRKTFQTEGLRGFYRGLSPNLLKVAPSVSISYIVYENSKRLFGLS